MRVNLIDLDIEKGKTLRRHPFPNLALMKLSSYHKAKGDDVSLNFLLDKADIYYASCVFTWHRERVANIPLESYFGGSGFQIDRMLPYEVEHIMPDYSLYSNVDFSMGYTTRGCSRHCPWCLVPVLEGQIQDWAHFREFWNPKHNKILFLDNNMLAAPSHRQTLIELGDLNIEVDFNQGLDIRLINDEIVYYLNRIKSKKLRFAFDDLSYEQAVRRGIKILLGHGIAPRRLSFYVLVGFDGDETALERMMILHSYGVDVYPMVYKNTRGEEPLINIPYIPKEYWHGARGNLRKFLRLAGRLP